MLDEKSPVMLVDDSNDDLFLIRHALEGAGLRNPLVTRRDGREFVDYLEGAEPKPGLVLLDIKMPVMSGLEALSWMRAQPRWEYLPVIIFSASLQPVDVRAAYALGANAFLVKPGSVSELETIARGIKCFWIDSAVYPEAV